MGERADDSAPAPSAHDPSSTGLVTHARSVYDGHLDDGQRRLTRILLVVLAICLVMLITSGLWQFFRHAPDPSWADATPEHQGAVAELEEGGGAGWHGLWSTLTGALIVVGGGIFALRVAHRMPRALWMSVLVVFAGAITGQLIRFNVIQPSEGPRTDERGYLQTFSGGNEYVLTDDRAYSPTTFAALVLLHLAILPILALIGWYGLRRLRRPDPDDRSAERVGWIVSWDPSNGE